MRTFYETIKTSSLKVSFSIKLAASAWPLRHGRFGGQRLG
jgi:hypothetical protein